MQGDPSHVVLATREGPLRLALLVLIKQGVLSHCDAALQIRVDIGTQVMRNVTWCMECGAFRFIDITSI
jgi:hypothetical protein